jgi:hypothetical protein
LHNIEPFTLIVAGPGQLFECRWNGKHKFQKQLNPESAFCWSSATLYNLEQQHERESWFLEAFENGALNSIPALMDFHGTPGRSDPHYDIMLSRPNGLETVSTTIVQKNAQTIQMDYCDYLSSQRTSLQMVMGEVFSQL